jgi:hypothetical protein
VENLLTPPWRDAVLGLIEPGRDTQKRSERLERGAVFHTPGSDDYRCLLEHIVTAPSVTLRAVAAYHIGELGLMTLRPALEAIDTDSDHAIAEVVVNAIKRLDRAQEADA